MVQETTEKWAFSFLGICPRRVKCASGCFGLGGLEPLSNTSEAARALVHVLPQCSFLQLNREDASR